MEEEVPHKKETKIDIATLCDEFMKYYKDFDDAFKLTGLVASIICYVLFGISGAGKSTTVARLLSTAEPEVFFSQIKNDQENNKRFTTIADITIGHTVNSCTVVPKPYIIEGYSVCDMPGFAENDPQKKISIDVLQKCFLTRVKKSRLLVVVDINDIYDTKCTKLLKEYHQTLWELMGDQYENAVDHLYFVLTKNHELNATSDTVRTRLNQVVLEIIHERKNIEALVGVRFLSRMANCHIIVDLETDDHNSLLRKITDMIQEQEAERQQTNRVDDLKIEKLEVGENKLNALCSDFITQAAKNVNTLEDGVDSLSHEWSVRRKTFESDTEKALADVVRADNERVAIKKQLESVRVEMENFPNVRNGLKKQIFEYNEMLSFHQHQKTVFKGQNYGKDLVNVRCDVAQESRSMSGKVTYSAKINADILCDGSTEQLVLVMDYEKDDTTLKKFINRGGSIIPTSLESIRKISAASVLYNSHTMVNDCNMEKQGKNEGGVLSLSIKRDNKFKIYVFSKIPFEKTLFFEDMARHMDEQVKACQSKIAELQGAIESLEKSHETNRIKKKNLIESLAVAVARVEKVKESGRSVHKDHEAAYEATKARVAKLDEKMHRLKNDKVVTKISDIMEVFRLNNIETGTRDALIRYEAMFGGLSAKLASLNEALDRFQKADAEELLAIHQFDVEEATETTSRIPEEVSTVSSSPAF